MITPFSSPVQEAPELDRGGWARLDISDLVPSSREDNDTAGSGSLARDSCGWCEEETASGEYVVVADNRHYHVCPTCWGRSATYMELRGSGLAHDDAMARLSGTSARYSDAES